MRHADNDIKYTDELPHINTDPSKYDFSSIAAHTPLPPHNADKFTRRVMAQGFSTRVRPRFQGKLPRDITYQPPPHISIAYDLLIDGLMAAGVLEKPTAPLRKCILNKHFAAPKPTGVLRLLFNGKRVNRCLNQPPPFTMDNVAHLTTNASNHNHTHASEADLRSAYFQLKVAPAFRRFLCISTRKHGVLQYARLPMGMSWASFCLHKCLHSTTRVGPHPTTTLVYADNVYPLGPTHAATADRLHAVVAHLEEHQWVLNRSKQREPFREGDILGIHVNFTTRTTQPTSSFRAGLQSLTTQLLARPDRLVAQRLLGSTIWAAQADPAFLRYTHHLVHSIVQAPLAKHAPIRITRALATEAQSLAQYAASSLPFPFPEPPPPPQHLIYTDASSTTAAFSHVHDHAAPAHLQRLDIIRDHKPTVAEYATEIHTTKSFEPDPTHHINVKEALALDSGMQHASSHQLADTVFAVDSQVLFGAVLKGRSNNPHLHDTATKFADLRAAGLRPRIAWTSTMNNFADVPTRVALGALDTNIN
jgi:hypothetical protein